MRIASLVNLTMIGTAMKHKTILLLTSDRLLLTVTREILEREGYSVFSSHDLADALGHLEVCKADLLITRSSISSMTGHDAAKYLRSKCPGMRVLILGGVLEDDRLHHRATLEGFEVFPKPYAASDFIEKVKEVLNRNEPRPHP
jgi:DNA-binding NtrC family response regulator